MSNTDVRTRRSFLLGAASNWLAFAAVLAVSFFLTPYLITALGTPRYDVWCVVESVLAYFTLLDMGVAACLVRSVARHHATAERDELNRIASSCLALFLAAGAVAILIGAPVLVALAPRMEAKSGADDVLPFMLLMLANLAATLPLSIFPSILDGLQKFTAKSVVRILFLLARTAGIVAVVHSEAGLLPLAVVYTVTNVAENAVLAALCFRFLPGLRLARRFVDRGTLREVRGYSTDAFLAMLAGRVTVQTGAIVVGVFLPEGQVTLYAIAARLVEYAKTLLRTITTTLTPGVSAMEARGDHAGVRRLFLTATRWMLYAVVPVNLGLWFFGRPFLARWVGQEFVEGSFPALALMATTLSVGVAQSVSSRILYGLGRLRLFARAALGEAALNLILTLALTGPLGVEGVATAVAVPNLLFCLFVVAYTARLLDIPMGEYLRAGWLRPVLAGAVPVVVWAAAGEVAPTWGAIAVGIAAGLLPYAMVVAACETRPTGWRKRLVALRATAAR
ncbi:oligosaccharide flippase family protein [Fimbriiglobus ruber]|uniref:Polysaccharide biosynthesis protein n=1 Tax=Fimbriiglobus ruber TaxID=1908690 RepID=A0A225DJ33_9BACT|nr:oligosaccharide flippase family protein [Fimbriiglobus ruber]OWK37486.1 polysaccharide biosynthesis protein [Fimbriiglobus ruber]